MFLFVIPLVTIVRSGLADSKGLLKSVTNEDYINYGLILQNEMVLSLCKLYSSQSEDNIL